MTDWREFLGLEPEPPAWEGVHRRIDLALSGDKAATAHETVDWFRQLLGNDWPGFTQRHQLAASLQTDWANVMRRRAQSIAHLPQALDTAKSLGEKAPEAVASAAQTLTLAAGFNRSGKLVRLVGRGRHTVVPDLHVQLRDRWVTFELTALQPSGRMEDGWAFWTRLFDLGRRLAGRRRGLVRIRFDDCCRPYEMLERFDEIETHVRQLVDDLASERTIEGLGVFTYDASAGHELCVVGDGAPQEIIDSFGSSREARRVVGRLDDKGRKQLQGHGATVLALRSQYLLWQSMRDRAVLDESLADVLRMRLAPLPWVSAIMLHESARDGGNPERSHVAVGNDRAVNAPDGDGSRRWAILVNNPAAVAPLTEGECDDLVGPAACW